MRSKILLATLVSVALIASNAMAATVHYTLDLSVADVFSVYAQDSLGDNGGLAVFGVPLLGTVTSVDNVAPQVTFAQRAAPLFNGSIGFNTARSGDSPGSVVNPILSGSLDLTNANLPNNLVYHFGQTDSSFVGEGWTVSFGPEQEDWGLPLLLATGTYDSQAGTLSIAQTTDLIANVLASDTASNAPPASVTYEVIPLGGSGPDVPESASITLFALAMIGLAGLRRRR
jgi:hypothetical protein